MVGEEPEGGLQDTPQGTPEQPQEGAAATPELDPELAAIVEENAKDLPPVPEGIAPEVLKEAQRRFTIPQQRMAEKLREAEARAAQAADLQRRFDELERRVTAPPTPPQPKVEETPPDPIAEPEKYEDWRWRQRMQPILERQEAMERKIQERERAARVADEEKALYERFPTLADKASAERKTFEAFLASKDPRAMGAMRAFADGLISSEQLYWVAMGGEAVKLAEQRAIERLTKKAASGVASGGVTGSGKVKSYDKITDAAWDALREVDGKGG